MNDIRVEQADNILTLSFDHVDKKNAITDKMYGILADEISAAENDPLTRVILLRADGDTFTAGNDLADFASGSQGKTVDPPNVRRFLGALAAASRPIVAAVQGAAVGVGTTMLLHCDYVVLADTARLTTPFVNLALVPEAASSHLLPARIGYLRAFAMFALGEAVPAETALTWGLANRVVNIDELDAAAAEIAARLAAQPLGAVIATKRLMRDPEALSHRMDVEGESFAARLKSPEAQEAFAAFAARRKPDFSQFR